MHTIWVKANNKSAITRDMNNDKISQALQWLDEEGWSELIDPRWTLEVYYELQTSELDLTDADIRETLDIVIYDKPDYNPANY